jgi:glycine hydroxymethyltransferase
MAEGILRDALPPRALAVCDVLSAGVGAVAGLPPSDHSVTACAEKGIDIAKHRSRPISRALVAESDLLLAMEEHHALALRALAPDMAGRIEVLARYAAQEKGGDFVGIADPIGGDLEDYRAARDQIEEQVLAALPRIEREILSGVNS